MAFPICVACRYPEIVQRIEELQDLGITVINGLDCTWLDGKLDFTPDLVYFNFPHAGKPDKVRARCRKRHTPLSRPVHGASCTIRRKRSAPPRRQGTHHST